MSGHRRPVLGRRVALLAIFAAVGCSDRIFEPSSDCSSTIGVVFIQLHPPPEDLFASYTIDVGDSIRVTGTLRRVDESEPVFNIQQGWYCRTVASSGIGGAVSLGTTDTLLLRLHPSGWMRGLQHGLALVQATSGSPEAHLDFGVLVR